jgi:subtilase family serine protease
MANAGAGYTIALIDAYYDPNLDPANGTTDLQVFDSSSNGFGLPDPPNYTFARPYGTVSGGGGLQSSWANESALDVEWAHAMAPGANIMEVEAKSQNFTDLMNAVKWAANNGANVISMSWGFGESSSETSYDNTFTHAGVTYVAASGDTGRPAGWPAFSPHVLAVGGTTLRINTNGTWHSETGWSGSGGGISAFEAQPSYQNGIVTQSSIRRCAPDVAYNANLNTGIYVYDGFNGGYFQVGGTSCGAPQWAAIIALADQARGSSLAYSDTLPGIYGLSSSDFHDITRGNNGYAAGPGYDLVTGRGTPNVANLVPDLAAHAPCPGAAGRSATKTTGSETSSQHASPVPLSLATPLTPLEAAAGALLTSNPVPGVPQVTPASDWTVGIGGAQVGSLGMSNPVQAQWSTAMAPAASSVQWSVPAMDDLSANDLGSLSLSANSPALVSDPDSAFLAEAAPAAPSADD